jgi:tRNA threonylcarbamoyladenosine biosynthesis protein TsaE
VAERTFVTSSPEETEALGAALGRALLEARRAGLVIGLDGELGAGKTCLVRGLAEGLGVEGPVASPTYVLMHEYPGPLPLYHFDAWMEGREEAFLEGGGAELLEADGVSAVEWASRVERWLPEPRLAVALAHGGPDAGAETRTLTLTVVGAGPGADALTDLVATLEPGSIRGED